jgi:hypothetical protein
MSRLGSPAHIAPKGSVTRNLVSSIVAAIAVLSLASCAQDRASGPFAVPDGATLIGNPPTQSSPVTLAAIQTEPAAYLGKTVLIQATAEDVCQAMGCWMTVKGDGPTMWVRWSSGCGGEFSFPKDVAGKNVVIEGMLREKEMTPEEAQHLAAESKTMEAAEITGKTFEIDAVSCVVLRGSA